MDEDSFEVTKDLAIESGACESRVLEVLAHASLIVPIRDGELACLLKVISWSAFKAGHKDLRSANLRSADLSWADLHSANLRSANLVWADLRSTNLSSADLCGANLISADLRWANLRSADLRSADLSSADLRSADLSSADLSWATFNDKTLWPEGFDFMEATKQ